MWIESIKVAGIGIFAVFVTLLILVFVSWLIVKLSIVISKKMEVESQPPAGIDSKRKIAAICAAIFHHEKGE